MSASTFLLILAAVVIIFVAFLIKTWFELSSATRTKDGKKSGNPDQDQGSGR